MEPDYEDGLTQEQIDYVTDTLNGHAGNRVANAHLYQPADSRTTICILTLHSGFEIVGKSHAATWESYNGILGNNYALDDALRQLVEFEVYEQLLCKGGF